MNVYGQLTMKIQEDPSNGQTLDITQRQPPKYFALTENNPTDSNNKTSIDSLDKLENFEQTQSNKFLLKIGQHYSRKHKIWQASVDGFQEENYELYGITLNQIQHSFKKFSQQNSVSVIAQQKSYCIDRSNQSIIIQKESIHQNVCLIRSQDEPKQKRFLNNFCLSSNFWKLKNKNILINLFSEYLIDKWNNFKFYLNMEYMFCDLSTNSLKYIDILIIQMDFSKYGIDNSHISCSRVIKSFKTLKLFCDFLLILLNIKYCKYEFSVTDNLNLKLKYRNDDPLLAHNQIKSNISMDRIRKFYNLWTKWTLRKVKTIENQAKRNFQNYTTERQRTNHHKLSNSHQKSNDYFNAIMFLIILCFPIISASSLHNIKYSTNIVKTKYGSLRGILVRTNPTIEAYLGVPYATPPVGSLR
jgi:hypothetical protein